MPRLFVAIFLSAFLGLAMLALPVSAAASGGTTGFGVRAQAEVSVRDGSGPQVALVVLLKRCIVGKTGVGESGCASGKAMPSPAGLSRAGGASCVRAAAADVWPPGIEPEPPRSPPRAIRI